MQVSKQVVSPLTSYLKTKKCLRLGAVKEIRALVAEKLEFENRDNSKTLPFLAYCEIHDSNTKVSFQMNAPLPIYQC